MWAPPPYQACLARGKPRGYNPNNAIYLFASGGSGMEMGTRGLHLHTRHAWHVVSHVAITLIMLSIYLLQEGVEWRWEHVGSTSIPGMPGTW
jgi:hypothetical protein